MLDLVRSLWLLICDLFKSQERLRAENLLLRHQLNIALRRAPPRPRLLQSDRVLLVWMTRFYPEFLGLAQVVKPETILRWHRAGFRAFWRWKSRKRAGRPKIDRALRDLIRRMNRENLCVPKTSSAAMQRGNRLTWRNDCAVMAPLVHPRFTIQIEMPA
jgi:hypothetical protein